MLDSLNLKKIEQIINKKNMCDIYFNKKYLKNYFNDFKIFKNNGFVIWQYLSLNSFINYLRFLRTISMNSFFVILKSFGFSWSSSFKISPSFVTLFLKKLTPSIINTMHCDIKLTLFLLIEVRIYISATLPSIFKT